MANPCITQTLPIYKQTYELLLMIVKARKQFSREYRYNLGSHLFESALRCLELIQKANTEYHRPTLDDIKRTCHRIAMAYLGEINYNPDTFDFSPYLVY